MTRSARRAAAALALLSALGGAARGEPHPRPVRPLDLSVRRLPIRSPTSLGMRARVAAAAPARPAPPAAGAFEPAVPLPAIARQDAAGELAGPGLRLDEKVVFRFNLGFGIDGGQESDAGRLLSNDRFAAGDYAPLRSYSFGDLVVGTRGLVFPTVTSYLAGEFRFDQEVSQPAQAIPSVHYDDEVENVLIRSAYAETQGFFRRNWLRPLYVRAGRQFKYGVTVAHFDGLSLGYETRPLSTSIWFGSLVSLYGFGQIPTDSVSGLFGSNTRIDLHELGSIPLVFTADTLNVGSFDHQEYGVAYRWKPDILIRGSVRQLDYDLARATLAVWARLSEVTTLTAEVDNRTGDDWIYDLIVVRPTQDPADPRNYLNLRPPLPRVQLDVRAGTVILRNLDVLLRGAAAIEHASGGEDGAFSPSYLEAGAALEVRLRRNVRLGSSFLARRYQRDPEEIVEGVDGTPDPLLSPDDARVGERSFYEGGLGVDYSVGARRFNASGELYGRVYDRQSPFEPPDTIDGSDIRTGGRFSVEGWASNRLRIKAEYDISISDIDLAPELRGVKSLRVLAEGSY